MTAASPAPAATLPPSVPRMFKTTIDPDKVSKAANNALIGNVEDVAKQMVERFHPEDRIMAWFDFFNHDTDRVCRNMTAYMEQVVPMVESMLKEA